MKIRIAGGEIEIDAEDRGIVEGHGWVVCRKTQHGRPYVQVQRWNKDRKCEQLARVVMDPSGERVVVHLNGDRLDFRRDNLVVVTRRQARLLGERFEESGVSVEWRADWGLWCVRHQIGGEVVQIVALQDETDARSVAVGVGRVLADVLRRTLADSSEMRGCNAAHR